MASISRRDILRLGGLALLGPVRLPSISPSHAMLTAYVGTYTNGESEGIYRCSFNDETGALEVMGVTGLIPNPSYLALHPSGRYLYSVSETGDYQGGPGGGVFAYAINSDGKLAKLNDRPSHGGAPCYITVTPDGSTVLVANYSGGNVAALPIQPDGRLGDSADVENHADFSSQDSDPLGHCIIVGPSGRRAYAADKGLDRVIVYRLVDGGLSMEGEGVLDPGSGPRHVVFHPNGDRLYVINELASTVTVFRHDDGALTPLQTLSTLPDGFDGRNTTADIHVSTDGRFLYGSNRGHDSIAVFAIDPADGLLSAVGHTRTGGQTPRNFALSPSGRFLLAANQRSDSIVVFRRDPDDGRLTETGHVLAVPSPVCIKFAPTA